jgi:hypothetical protein
MNFFEEVVMSVGVGAILALWFGLTFLSMY